MDFEFSTFEGRHPINSVWNNQPITQSVFGSSVENPNDFAFLTKVSKEFIERHSHHGQFQMYITGLTQGTTAFINAWMQLQCPVVLILYHYDRNTENYVPQILMPPQEHQIVRKIRQSHDPPIGFSACGNH